jgi:hypothetical protein
MLSNLNVLENLSLVEVLDEQAAETVSGGLERFTIYNQTNVRIPYAVDGTQTTRPYGGSVSVWTTGRGGTISFDYDFGRAGVQRRKYNLANGRKYAFRYDTRTPYSGDIELYDIT